jgi:cyclophilin family peptidyl-prolyl cis-trans isomerase
VTNFLHYVQSGDFDSNWVHRSLPGALLQGGFFNWYQQTGVYYTNAYDFLKAEDSVSHLRGTVAMIPEYADDPDTALSQWFINLQDGAYLDAPAFRGYTVFARVVYGMDVLDKIGNYKLVDLSSYFHDYAFTAVPTSANTFEEITSRDNFVIINRAYATDLLPGTVPAPYHCSSPVANEALTEVCSGALTFPVEIKGDGFYEVTLQVAGTTPVVTAAIKPGSLTRLTTAPAVYGSYDKAARTMTIPSVRTGTIVYSDLVLSLVDDAAQLFLLKSFR